MQHHKSKQTIGKDCNACRLNAQAGLPQLGHNAADRLNYKLHSVDQGLPKQNVLLAFGRLGSAKTKRVSCIW